MIDFLHHLNQLMTPMNLFICFIGALYGTFIGILPGLTSAGGAALLIPFLITYASVEQAAIVLTSIAYGAQYGSSTGAILLNLPGEPSSVITTLDGHPLSKMGHAKSAVFVSAMSSFIAGILSTFFIIYASKLIISLTLNLHPFDYFCIVFSAICLIFIMIKTNARKICLSLLLGMVFGMIGMTVNGTQRLMFGIYTLSDGLDLGILTLCLFGITDIFYYYLKQEYDIIDTTQQKEQQNIKLEYVKQSIFPALRGSIIGFLGAIPGIGYSLPSIISYNIEKYLSKTKSLFGYGNIAGVAGPEAANNSAAQSSLIPLLILGIPTGAITAIILSVLSSKGINIGPQFAIKHSNIFWSIISSMIIINVFLLILNWPLANLWAKMLKIKRHILNIMILILCCIGMSILSLQFSELIIAGVLVSLGVYLKTYKYNIVYVFIGFILVSLLEGDLLRSLKLEDNNILNLIYNHPIHFALIISYLIIIAFKIKENHE
jgi:putative tricarboxylic transport membrane protein